MYNIGIDLGGTNIAAAIVDEKGKIVIKESIPTKRERNYQEILKDMALLAKKLIMDSEIDNSKIHSIGIGSPGTCDAKNGIIVYANNLKFRNVPIREEINKYIDLPVYVENDANSAAYGEYCAGVGSKFKDFVAITLGTGVGGGIVIDNKLITGSFFGGAEVGHMVIVADGSTCTCGRKGCWEEYSSATALIREAKKAAYTKPKSKLNELVNGDIEKINAKTVFDAKELNDEVAKDLVEWYIKYLAIGLTNMINIFQPEAIALGGGVSAQKEKIINPLRKQIAKQLYGGAEALKTELVTCELGNNAGIIGAAMLYKLYD